MKKTNLLKILMIIILFSLCFLSNSQCVYAQSIGDIFTGADDFIQDGVNDENITIEDENLQEMSGLVYNTLLIIAIVIAVAIGLVIGIQFMTGSVGQKAKIKETLIPYVAGCIVIFGAFGIWKLVINIMNSI